MSDQKETAVDDNISHSSFSGDNKIQYITTDLLRRYTKTQDLSTVHHLCLTSNIISPYRLTLLENLEELRYLTVLNVSGNAIERLEGLRSLTRLKCLNLNENRVCRLDGIETLKNLQRLYLNHNLIQDFPSWFQNRLVSLKSLHIGHNKIVNLHILTKLRRLSNLTELVIKGNPATDPANQHSISINFSLPLNSSDQHEAIYNQCCRSFVIFHLRTLTLLDSKVVTPEERKEADLWFEQSEISRINSQLESREAEVADLSDCLARLSIEAEGRGARAEDLARQKAAQDAKLEEMRCELAVKDELLRAKSDELLRACLRHYEIEQELAFYKIDTKLGAILGKPPDLYAGLGENGASNSGSVEPQTLVRTTGPTDESPYLGKCRYFRVSGASEIPYNPVLTTFEVNSLPRVKRNIMNGQQGPRRVGSVDFPSTSHTSHIQPSMLQAATQCNGSTEDEIMESDPASSGEFSEHTDRQGVEQDSEGYIQQEHQQQEEDHIRHPLTPLRMARVASALKGRSTSFAVSMPLFGASPEPSEPTEDSSWYRGSIPMSNQRDSPSSINNQRSTPRSTVRIQCDSGIDAGNNCSNDVQESSLDDGRIDSLPNSPRMEQNSSQRRNSSTQVSSSQSFHRTSSRCQTDSPDAEIVHHKWQERTKQRLARSPHQSIESISGRASVNENDLKIMKKELARLQSAVKGLSTERNRVNSETGSDDPGRQKTSDDVDFVSTSSGSPNNNLNNNGNQLRRSMPDKGHANKTPPSRRERSNDLACSWNAGDRTEDSATSEFEQTRGHKRKIGANRLVSCLRGATSAVDIRRNQHRASTGCLKTRGKSMEVLPDNTPLDVQLLYKLQDELYDLHDRLQYAENANASRLEEAIQHIEVLESELKRSRGRRDSSGERRWQNQLSKGLEEMRKCRDSILELQRRLVRGGPGVSQDLRGQTDGIDEVRSTLNAQERELSKLTRVVSRLAQNSHVIDNSVAEVTEVARVVPSGKLLCNVAEHHNLEDYLQHVQATADDLRKELQGKRAKSKDLKSSLMELQGLLKEREAELTRVTNELLLCKEELLRANEKVKSMISERSSQDGHFEAERLESKIADLTKHLGDLRAEVSAVERQKERRAAELAEISRKVDEKRVLMEKRPSHSFTGFTTEVSICGDGNPRSDSANSMSPRNDMDRIQPKIAEARNRMESLSREIGVRTAEIELLRSKKAQEMRMADTQLENARRELQLKLDELNNAKASVSLPLEELSSVRQERDRLTSEIQSARQSSSLHPTSDGIPPISGDVSELTQQLNKLQADVGYHKNELVKLEAMRKTGKEEVSQLEKSLMDTKEELTLAQTRRQNAETQLALTRRKGELLKGQLEAFEASVEVKQKLISDLCSSSESRIFAMQKEVDRMHNSTQKIAIEKANLKAELVKLKEQVQARSSELRNLEEQITSANQQLEIPSTNSKVARASDKLRILNEKIASQKAESERLSREISERQALFEKMKAKVQYSDNLPADMEEMETRLEELEKLLRLRDHKIETLKESNTKLMEDHSQIVSDLTSTRSQLEAAQRACKKLKRRTAKELADLERVAEEQCNRASAFAEELTLLRRNYTYLQARIAANEEVSDREQKLQEALFAIKTELASSNVNGTNVALRHFDAIESLVRRNIHSPLNGIIPTNLKSFSSVPQLSIPNGGSVESVREDQQIPSPNPPVTSVKTIQTPSSSGIGSSITPQSSSDDRMMILQEQARKQLLDAQANLNIERLKNDIEAAATSVTTVATATRQ
ncbi:hypothetical protein Aperf_G00000056983 [Anoplocephala perfoliata]